MLSVSLLSVTLIQYAKIDRHIADFFAVYPQSFQLFFAEYVVTKFRKSHSQQDH